MTDVPRRRRAVEQVGIVLVEHPFDHRPGHHRKARHEMHVAPTLKPGILLYGLGMMRAPSRKHAHVQPVDVVRRGRARRPSPARARCPACAR